MTDDRAKAEELIFTWDADDHGTYADLADRIAAALAEARAPYDRLTADLRALAEEYAERAARYQPPTPVSRSYGATAARLRGLVTDNNEEE